LNKKERIDLTKKQEDVSVEELMAMPEVSSETSNWWLETVPAEERNKVVMAQIGSLKEPVTLTANQIAKEMKERTEIGKGFLKMAIRDFEKTDKGKAFLGKMKMELARRKMK
jgi:hypothetical protein